MQLIFFVEISQLKKGNIWYKSSPPCICSWKEGQKASFIVSQSVSLKMVNGDDENMEYGVDDDTEQYCWVF